MNWIDLTLLVIALGGLGVVAFFSYKKFPFLSSLDTVGLQKLDEGMRKNDMVARRLKRKVLTAARTANKALKPMGSRIERQIQSWLKRVEQMEHEYQSKMLAQKTHRTSDTANAARTAMEEGVRLQESGEIDDAEKKFIAAITLAPQQPAGYTALGKYYLEKKEYIQAEESFRHAVRLEPTNDEAYLDLIAVCRVSGKMDQAAALCQEAVRHAPNSPKVLNELLEVSIAIGDKQTAQLALKALTEANPENQRLDELSEQVEGLK